MTDSLGSPVTETMSTPVATCRPDTDIATVARLMWDYDCGFVPVVSASGVIVGVVTDRDICMAAATHRLLPEHIPAAQVMTSPVYTCLTTDSVNDALATMRQFRIRRLPVIDATGHLQGVASIDDLVIASERNNGPGASEIVTALAAICSRQAHAPVRI